MGIADYAVQSSHHHGKMLRDGVAMRTL